MMKHLALTSRTLDHLPKVDRKWIRIHFYFNFRAGNSIANTILGMLRFLVLQLFENLPDEHNIFMRSKPPRNLEDALADDLKDIVRRAIEFADAAVLALIDGLDEYTGELEELAQSLLILKDHSGMKMCLASRPEGPLSSIFRNYPSLRMQDYNSKSIQSYIESAVDRRRHSFKSPFPDRIKEKVVAHANGVILWARFAIDDLLDSCDDGLSTGQLEQKLDDLPRELEELYQRILDRKLGPEEKRELALVLQIMRNSFSSMMVSDLHAIWCFILNRSQTGFEPVMLVDEDDFKSRLLAMSKGLVDIGESVSLMHKTVESYLESSSWIWQNLPHLFQQRYSDRPLLRICASMIEDAATEIKLDRDEAFLLLETIPLGEYSLETTLKRTAPEHSWQGWPPVLNRTLTYFFRVAEFEEGRGYSTFEIIRNAMDTGIISLHIACCGSSRGCLRHNKEHWNLQSVQTRHLGLMYGTNHSLLGYVRGLSWVVRA